MGDVRVGVAASDPGAILATPVETLRRGPGDVARLVDLVQRHEAVEVIVGLPTTLSGRAGRAVEKAAAFARELRREIVRRGGAASVRLVDERLTTVSAEQTLRQQGRKGARRRAVVDQVAAVLILQQALDRERATGRPPGEEVGWDS